MDSFQTHSGVCVRVRAGGRAAGCVGDLADGLISRVLGLYM